MKKEKHAKFSGYSRYFSRDGILYRMSANKTTADGAGVETEVVLTTRSGRN